jgi:hypothetical protein
LAFTKQPVPGRYLEYFFPDRWIRDSPRFASALLTSILNTHFQPPLLDAFSHKSPPLQGASQLGLASPHLILERKSFICHLQSDFRPSADTSLVVAPLTPTSTTSSSPLGSSFSHRRRRSSAANLSQGLNVQASNDPKSLSRGATTLAPIPGTFYLLRVPSDQQRTVLAVLVPGCRKLTS